MTEAAPPAPAPEISTPPAQPAPAAPVAAAPAATAPAVQAPAPAAEVSPPQEKSLLGAEPPKPVAEAPKDVASTGAPKVDGAPVVEPKKEEGSQSAEPASLPAYEAFTLPEGTTFDDGKLGEFTKELAEFEILSKADHASMQEFGQKLVSRHVAEVQNTVQRLTEHYQEAWAKQGNDWKEAFEKDPEIGGNRKDTTITAITEAIAQYGGKPEQQAEFRQLMDQTRVGNNPALIRTMNNLVSEINRLKTAYEKEDGVKPLAAPKPAATTIGKVEKRYGKLS